MTDGLKILFVFIDGLGLGSDDPAVNPLAWKKVPDIGKNDVLATRSAVPQCNCFPNLGRILDASIPLDAQLGVPGLPQSATGQASLLCGLNAPQLMGRHIEGFPPPRLKTIVQEHNIFSKLLAAGKRCTFANEYYLDDVAHIPPRRESVTTVATLAAFGGVRGKAELAENRAVYHDLTREALRARGYDGPLITPEEAAEHLIGIASDHDFTLFEFFQTDHAGHSGDEQRIFQTLEKLDRFFAALLPFRGLLVVTSDHGNIEDLTVRTHTMNPVPLFFQCLEKDRKNVDTVFQTLEKIDQLVPAISDLLIN
jgi:hypothetical protein